MANGVRIITPEDSLVSMANLTSNTSGSLNSADLDLSIQILNNVLSTASVNNSDITDKALQVHNLMRQICLT